MHVFHELCPQFISGNSWSLEEAKKVFAKTDMDHDGKISLEEFKVKGR